ncbi:unnamed protein product [Chrysodeixis includens]|uniref:Uncharacterized protein n=1 Tax=Chrysodeixis includens TaxID=689277 RepID=A0A9P0BWX1_CHRIL|nr:unnamed protein product [Chrysodeixis includens]
MKFAVVILACVAAASAQFRQGQYQQYQPFRYNQYSTPKPFRYQPVVYNPTPAPIPVAVSPVAPIVPVVRAVADARNAQTLKYGNDVNPDGSYSYFFETDNGIAAQAQGTPRNFGGNPPVVPDVAQGSFSWTAPDGTPVVISYVADENGYQPSGNAIPTPPPVPAQIARALEYIARNGQKK